MHTLSAWAVAFSTICIVGSLLLMVHKKAVAGGIATMGLGTLGMTAWTAALNVLVYRDEGRACSFQFETPVTDNESAWKTMWSFQWKMSVYIWHLVVAVFLVGVFYAVCKLVLKYCMRSRRDGQTVKE